MAYYADFIEVAATLKRLGEAFEADLRAGLKAELMRLAEERIDALIDETIRGLQTRLDGARDVMTGSQLIQITVKRDASSSANASDR